MNKISNDKILILSKGFVSNAELANKGSSQVVVDRTYIKTVVSPVTVFNNNNNYNKSD